MGAGGIALEFAVVEAVVPSGDQEDIWYASWTTSLGGWHWSSRYGARKFNA